MKYVNDMYVVEIKDRSEHFSLDVTANTIHQWSHDNNDVVPHKR